MRVFVCVSISETINLHKILNNYKGKTRMLVRRLATLGVETIPCPRYKLTPGNDNVKGFVRSSQPNFRVFLLVFKTMKPLNHTC